MPFFPQTPLTINVTTADIAAGTTSIASLVVAMERLNAAYQLPGEMLGDDQSGYAFQTTLNPRFNNGQLLSLFDVLCAAQVYSADVNTDLILAGELLGVKPSVAYTATLVYS